MQRVKSVNTICNHEVVEANGYYVCSACGLVLDRVYTSSSETNTIGKTIDGSKVLGSFIDYKITKNSKGFKDEKGKILVPESQRLFRRIKKRVIVINHKENETESRIFKILKKIASDLQLPKYIVDNSAYSFTKILRSGCKIINNVSCICFCIWDAIKYSKYLINLSGLLKCFNDNNHRVNNKFLIRDGFLYSKYLVNANTRIKQPKDYIAKQIDTLRDNKDIIKQRLKTKNVTCFPTVNHYLIKLEHFCYEVLDALQAELNRYGLNPFVCSVSCVYFVDILMSMRLGYKKILTQDLISAFTGVADFSLRFVYLKRFKQHFDIELEGLK